MRSQDRRGRTKHLVKKHTACQTGCKGKVSATMIKILVEAHFPLIDGQGLVEILGRVVGIHLSCYSLQVSLRPKQKNTYLLQR
jgi:hypothetical protein